MSKPEWGKKIVCPECSSKFYDLNKKYPVECTGCGVFIALNEMLQYGSDAKKVHEDDLAEVETGNLVGDDATESLSDTDTLDDDSSENLIKQLIKRNIGVLITDHNVREVLDICDYSYVLHSGEIIAEGDSNTIIGNENARKLYLGDSFRV